VLKTTDLASTSIYQVGGKDKEKKLKPKRPRFRRAKGGKKR